MLFYGDQKLCLVTAVCLLLCATGVCQPEKKTIVVDWNEAVLEAVRGSPLGPPMVARALAVVHTCIYDAWASFDPKAKSTEANVPLQKAVFEQSDSIKRAAISYAAYQAATDLFPEAKETIFDPLMTRLGYAAPTNNTDRSVAYRIGTQTCATVLATRHQDGSNQLGNLSSTRTPYADYTGYMPVNPTASVPVHPDIVKDPDRFQPLRYSDVQGKFHDPFLGAQWFKVRPFAGSYEHEMSQVASEVPLARFGSREYEAQARELVEISAGLTDKTKMISEYWTDGPNSELPPGHWCLFAAFISARDHHTLDDDVKLFFVLTTAASDAGIAAWTLKRRFDSIRPVSAIPYVLKGQQIMSWGGPANGTMTMDASEWIPYQPSYFPSPPFPEYPSGHSAFSAAAARILELWTRSEKFGASVLIRAGSSKVEPSITPRSDVVLEWATFADAADQAGMSRRYGGLHFRAGDLAGRKLGRLVADRVWEKAMMLFSGSQYSQNRVRLKSSLLAPQPIQMKEP